MKKHPSLPRHAFAAGTLSALIFAGSANAGLQIPYTANSDTLHLWHLNDPANQLYAQDYGMVPMTLTNLGQPGPCDGSIVTFASLGVTGYTNCNFGCSFGVQAFNNLLGTCWSSSNLVSTQSSVANAALLLGAPYDTSAPINQGGNFVYGNYCNATTGAFTWELLVKLNTPYAAGGQDIYFINGDNGASERGWQWRLDTGTQPLMELNGISESGSDPKMNIPLTGPDAIATNTWYHVAVTFTGTSPTNGDIADVLTMYWTLLDPARTNADSIGSFTNTTGFLGNGTPSFAIGFDARYVEAGPLPQAPTGKGTLSQENCPGTGDAFDFGATIPCTAPGGMAEARITDLCLKSNQMAFFSGGPGFGPVFISPLAPTSQLAGYGQPLGIVDLISATPPVSYQWYQGAPIAADAVTGQTNATLSIASPTFAAGGNYYLVASNPYGAATSVVQAVTIGAVASELYATGIGTNGQVSAGDIPDPHYTLIQSADANSLGPDAMMWESNCPVCAGGGYVPDDGISQWDSPRGNMGGSSLGDPRGIYTWRTQFVLDQVNPATATLTINTGSEVGEVVAMYLNGVSVGPLPTSASPGYALYQWAKDSITNQGVFVAGVNTWDIVVNSGLGGNLAGVAAFRMEPSLIGQANTNGTPVIIQQPANQTVRDAVATGTTSQATFSVVAVSQPPLTYQWWADGSPITGATTRALTYYSPTVGTQGTNFSVVVTGPSGSVTSSVATLTLLSSNEPPLAPSYTIEIYTNASQSLTLNQNVSIDTSILLANASDPIAGVPIASRTGDSVPDGNSLSISYDPTSTNGVSIYSLAANSIITYNPSGAVVQGAPDEFNYYISDAYGEMATGTIYIDILNGGPSATVTQSGINIVISGSGGAPFGAYNLLYTTNLLTPFTSWKTNTSGFFDTYGNFSITLPVSSKTNSIYTVLKWGATSSAVVMPPFQVER